MIVYWKKHIRRRRATVLIIVIWIALGLVSLALYFGHSMGLEYRAADNAMAGQQAGAAVEGARRYMVYILTNLETPGTMPDLLEDEYLAEEVPVGEASFWLVGRDPDTDSSPVEPVYGLVDEAAKLNVNTATLEMLEALPGMTAELAAAIVDWRDTDEDVTDGGADKAAGAESQDYLLLTEPYNAKNSEFESPEELRLVMGADPTLLYGEDVNRNGVLDFNEDDGETSWPGDNRDGVLDAGLVEYLTTFTREPNKREDGQARVNITGQNGRQELTQLLTETIGEGRSGQVIAAVGNQLASMGSVLEFYTRSGLTAEEFAQVETSITTESGDYLVGRVNVVTAPSVVLACLPGMNEELAGQLVAARRDLDQTERQSVAWVTGVLEAEVASQIGPHITARTWQLSADIAAVGHAGHGFRRDWLVFDLEDEVRVIYRRDWTRFGWPLGQREATGERL